MRNCMTRSITTVEAGTPHAALGLPTYVQFTSPIRRYTDLLAHYQVRPAPASVRTCPRMHALRSLPGATLPELNRTLSAVPEFVGVTGCAADLMPGSWGGVHCESWHPPLLACDVATECCRFASSVFTSRAASCQQRTR